MELTDLQWRYLSTALTADDQAASGYTVVSGAVSGSTHSVHNTEHTEADDFWDNAIIKWTGGSNSGYYSRVIDFLAASDTLVLAQKLPNTPSASDTYKMWRGGQYVSSDELESMETTGVSDVTGVTITKAAYSNGEGSGTLKYYNSTDTLSWTAPGDAEGSEVDVSANGSYTIYSDNGYSYITVTVVLASLPGSDQTDTVTLSNPEGILIPNYINSDLESGVEYMYKPVALYNDSASDSALGVEVWTLPPNDDASATTITAAVASNTDDTIYFSDASDWPTSGYVYNSTKGDMRYYHSRSGNTASVLDPDGGIRGYSELAWDSGDAVLLVSNVDIGLDDATVADPATETTAPSGITFGLCNGQSNALDVGTLAAESYQVIWLRIYLPAGARHLKDATSRLRVAASIA